MTESITAVCKTTMEIPEEGCRAEDDRFRNAALVSTNLLETLDAEPFEYIEAKPGDSDDDWSDAIYVQAVPLADEFEFQNVESGNEIVGMRTNVLRTIDDSLKPGDEVDIRNPDIQTSDELRVERSYADDNTGERCYISNNCRSRIGLEEWGNPVEVFHPKTGARTILPAWELEEWDNQETVAVDLHSRELLDVETGETLKVQRPVEDLRGSSSGYPIVVLSKLKILVLDLFIGRQTVSLKVNPGLSRDEHRNIARVNSDMMEVLGVESGDLATIEWKERTHNVQLLQPPNKEEVEPLSIKLPSTERDQIDISINDAASIHRNLSYYLKKNIVLSIFGVGGVIIGIFNIVDSIELFNRSPIGYRTLLFLILSISLIISIVVVWIVLFPERQAVTQTNPRE